MKWINVREKLPEVNAYCIVVNEHTNEINLAKFIFIATPTRYYFCLDNDPKKRCSVMYWMPLPKLPKEE